MIPIWKIVKKADSFVVVDHPIFLKWWRAKKDGTMWELIIRKKPVTVSDPLRKYYFKVVMQMIAEETGESVERIHEGMKHRYASHTDKKTGLVFTESVFGKKSRMKIKLKKQFVINVRNWAWDFTDGRLVIPDPQKVDH